MTVQVRLAAPADFPAVERLCAERPYLDSTFLPAPMLREFTLQHLHRYFEKYREAADVRLAVATRDNLVVGYSVLLLNTRETITQESQCLVFDHFAPDFEVLEPLLGFTRELAPDDEYVVVHLQEGLKKEKVWFWRLGFRPELNRVTKLIAPGHRGASSPRYLARPVRPNEHLFIIRVNAEYSAAYRPANRDTDLQIVQASFFGAYVALKLNDPDSHYRILEDRESKKPAGYIILLEHAMPMGRGRAYYTYDVAVAPEFAGRGLSLYLCGAAETLVGEAGGGLMYGDTSLDNLPAVNGDRALGFTIDSVRWGRRLVTLL